MTKFNVIGAGMAGLFAAAALRDECELVMEAQSELPNNHSALLRFRSSVVGDTLNIPFRPVDVIKTVHTLGNPVADAISYSLKTSGKASLRSVVTASGAVERRFIAPPDFINRMANKVVCPIELGNDWKPLEKRVSGPIISTLPMPVLMNLLEYPVAQDIKFGSVVGVTATATVKDCDICATVYIPDKRYGPYRASITGDQLIVEFAFPPQFDAQADVHFNGLWMFYEVLPLLGLGRDQLVGDPEFKSQRYAKILPIDDDTRKRFILWASEQHDIYSFGRFATWRPGLLLDDLVKDLRVIQRIAAGGTTYEARRG